MTFVALDLAIEIGNNILTFSIGRNLLPFILEQAGAELGQAQLKLGFSFTCLALL